MQTTDSSSVNKVLVFDIQKPYNKSTSFAKCKCCNI